MGQRARYCRRGRSTRSSHLSPLSGKDDLAREIILSWYGWYCVKLQRIVSGPACTLDKLREIVHHEFSAATDHSEAFVGSSARLLAYDCDLIGEGGKEHDVRGRTDPTLLRCVQPPQHRRRDGLLS